MRVLAIAGSLRAASYNRMLLSAAARALPPDAQIEFWEDLGLLPAYNEDLEPCPHRAVIALRTAVRHAHAMLIATPEYNASLPGALKNALDWASRPYPDNALNGKPAAVIGASTGLFGAVWSQAELRKVLRASGARVIEDGLPVGQADTAFDGDGNLRDRELAERLTRLVGALVQQARVPVDRAA